MNNDSTNRELLEQFKHGDFEAVSTIYLLYYNDALENAFTFSQDFFLAEQIAITSFATILLMRSKINSFEEIKFQLNNLVFRIALSYIELLKRYNLDISMLNELSVSKTPAHSPGDLTVFDFLKFGKQQILNILAQTKQMISDLSPGCLEIFEMIYGGGSPMEAVMIKLKTDLMQVLECTSRTTLHLKRSTIFKETPFLLILFIVLNKDQEFAKSMFS